MYPAQSASLSWTLVFRTRTADCLKKGHGHRRASLRGSGKGRCAASQVRRRYLYSELRAIPSRFAAASLLPPVILSASRIWLDRWESRSM